MSEFHEGRVAATFQVGHRLEDTKETYEKEVLGIDGLKAGLAHVITRLDQYFVAVHEDLKEAKIPVKEGETALRHITRCTDIVKQMLLESEGKRVAALGAINALTQVIADTKKLWDDEKSKLAQIQTFEAEKPLDMKNRPVGYMPKETALEIYQQETEHVKTETIEPPKAIKKTRKGQDDKSPKR